MAGALAERVFVDKLEGVGFADVAVLDREPWSVADVGQIPLFTPDLLELMRELLPPEQQAEVAMGIVVTATKPGPGRA